MDPNTKVLLEEIQNFFADELHKRFSESDLKWEHHFQEAERLHGDRIVKLESSTKEFEDWRPTINAAVDDVKLEISKLSRHWHRAVHDQAALDHGLFPTPSRRPSAHLLRNPVLMAFMGTTSNLLTGMRVLGWCSPNPLSRSRVCPHTLPPLHRSNSRSFGNSHDNSPHDSVNLGKFPKLHFPVFEGENPKLWLSRCEDYFEMYRVDPSIWVKVAVMQFQVSSSVARWALSVDKQLKRVSWPKFCAMLIDRFGRDQEFLIRQLIHIKQTGSVADNVAKFTELIDQLIVYDHCTDPLYYITRFIDGLRDDIRATVLVQHPHSLDTACTLALLQEEVADPARRRDHRRFDSGFQYRPQTHRGPLPLPAPPRRDKGVPAQPGISDPAVP